MIIIGKQSKTKKFKQQKEMPPHNTHTFTIFTHSKVIQHSPLYSSKIPYNTPIIIRIKSLLLLHPLSPWTTQSPHYSLKNKPLSNISSRNLLDDWLTNINHSFL